MGIVREGLMQSLDKLAISVFTLVEFNQAVRFFSLKGYEYSQWLIDLRRCSWKMDDNFLERGQIRYVVLDEDSKISGSCGVYVDENEMKEVSLRELDVESMFGDYGKMIKFGVVERV